MQIFSNPIFWVVCTGFTTAQIQVAPSTATNYGPYEIRNCKSNNANIAILIKTLRNDLAPVLRDLASPSSSDAYTVFFKDVSNAPNVRDVFVNITNGAQVPPKPGLQPSSPIFFCVDGRDQVSYEKNNKQVDALDQCRSYDDVPAMVLLNSQVIVICPKFFTHPDVPALSPASCYDVAPNGYQFVQDGKSLIRYQMWHILHELVHYYVYSTTQRDADVYGINACLTLPSREAIINAQSYSYYAANIRLGCTNFPSVGGGRPHHHHTGVELLETYANRTAVVNESIALVVQNVSVSAEEPKGASTDFDPNLTSRSLRKRVILQG